jgi:tetratricopeptide (TPR) repeat protein
MRTSLCCTLIFVGLLSVCAGGGRPGARAGQADPRAALATLVVETMDADYRAELTRLRQLHERMAPFTTDPALEPIARYWRGFALWRRALNTLNENPSAAAVAGDLSDAIAEFRRASALRRDFADAFSAAAHCVMAKFVGADRSQVQTLIDELGPLLQSAAAVGPNNPRVLWVVGGSQFFTPPERGGGHDKAIETYLKALAIARTPAAGDQDPLEPRWGEPEILMALSLAHFYRKEPDPALAEKYAMDALALVPHWRYVRDILLPQIRASVSPARR